MDTSAPLVMPATPLDITDAQFGATIKAYPLVIVDNWAPWCGPCRVVGPILDRLAKEMAGRVVIAKLNVDENPAVPQAFGVRGIPTMLVFRQGQLVDRIVGAGPYESLRARFESYL